MLNFLNAFLGFVESHVKADGETHVFQAINPGLRSRLVVALRDSDGQKRFLPAWYTAFVDAPPGCARPDAAPPAEAATPLQHTSAGPS